VGNDYRYPSVSEVSLAPFHNFSPTLKSLDVGPIAFPCPRLFDFVCSFPLLENLGLEGHNGAWLDEEDPYEPRIVIPSTSPVLSGNLEFHVLAGAAKIVRPLLDLPNGLHFRSPALSCEFMEDTQWVTELVTLCSHSLESLDILHTPRCAFICAWSTPIT